MCKVYEIQEESRMEAENARGPQSSTVGVEKQLSVSELHEIEVLLMVQVVASSFGGQVTDSCHACEVIAGNSKRRQVVMTVSVCHFIRRVTIVPAATVIFRHVQFADT